MTQGDDDQIVPYADANPLSAKLIPNAKLKIYPGYRLHLCEIRDAMLDAVRGKMLHRVPVGAWGFGLRRCFAGCFHFG